MGEYDRICSAHIDHARLMQIHPAVRWMNQENTRDHAAPLIRINNCLSGS